MIEQGLVLLLSADAAVAAIAPTGGYFSQLPEGTDLPAWSFTVISEPEDYYLTGEPDGLVEMRLQIDCYAQTPADCVRLAAAINRVLSGYRGTLSDPDATRVAGVFKSNKTDFFDQQSRTPRRCLEYTVWFYPSQD